MAKMLQRGAETYGTVSSGICGWHVVTDGASACADYCSGQRFDAGGWAEHDYRHDVRHQ